MKRVKLDRKDEKIKKFVQALSTAVDGTILELDGHPLVKVLPITEETVDEKLKEEAILRRRDRSRELNKEWEAVDREMWERIPDSPE